MDPRHTTRIPIVGLAGILSLTIMGFGSPGHTAEREPAVIGELEEVLVLPWEIVVSARVDTGAAISSLDARRIQIQRLGTARTVRFTLIGDGGQAVQVELPLLGHRGVATADGGRERRPVVRLEICLAGVQTAGEFTLNDRSRMHYHMLLGRNLLQGRFLVDVSRSFTGRPACPARR